MNLSNKISTENDKVKISDQNFYEMQAIVL